MNIEDAPKISDVIKQLEELKEECGDLPVVMECFDEDMGTKTHSILFEESSTSVERDGGFQVVWVINATGDEYIE